MPSIGLANESWVHTGRLFGLALGVVVACSPAAADITNWQTGQTIPGTEGIVPGPGVDLARFNTPARNLRYADLAGGLNLTGSTFRLSWLNDARFTGANLTGAIFGNADLTGPI